MTSPHTATTLKKFDVFTRGGRSGGWAYTGAVEAQTIDQAKQLFLQQNMHLKSHQLVVYPKR